MATRSEIEPKQKTPSFFLTFSSALLLILFPFGTSQYRLNALIQGGPEAGDPTLSLVGVFSLLSLVILIGLLIFSLLFLFLKRFLVYRVVLWLALALFALETGLEVAYAVLGFSKSFHSGDGALVPVLEAANLVAVGVNVLLFLVETVFLLVFVEVPYGKLSRSMDRIEKETQRQEDELDYEERMRKVYHEELDGIDREGMRKFLERKYAEGELTKEQYEDFLRQLGDTK